MSQVEVKKCNRPGCDSITAAVLRCSRCKSVYYCSAECQKFDWKEHKGSCNAENSNVPPLKTKTVSRLDSLRLAALHGDMNAQHELGLAYRDGVEGATIDLKEAAQWFLKAAEQGHQWAQFDYGEALYKGAGVVEKNGLEAARYFRRSADQGNELALKSLPPALQLAVQSSPESVQSKFLFALNRAGIGKDATKWLQSEAAARIVLGDW